MSAPQTETAILFADVCGGTALYERLSAEAAKARLEACLDMLATVTVREGGRVVKTIGDKMMCVFDNPGGAATAACAMHELLQDEAGTDPLALRIGIQYGPVIGDGDDVFGDAVNVAARMTDYARPGQTMTTASALAQMPAIMQASARHVDSAPVKGKASALEIYEILWQQSDVTRMAADSAPAARPARVLELDYRGMVRRLDASRPQLVTGRSRSAELTIDEDLASRLHARFEQRRGKFFLVDQSTNGTYVKTQGQEAFLRRDEIPLSGAGEISLGRPFSDVPPGTAIRFRVTDDADIDPSA